MATVPPPFQPFLAVLSLSESLCCAADAAAAAATARARRVRPTCRIFRHLSTVLHGRKTTGGR